MYPRGLYTRGYCLCEGWRLTLQKSSINHSKKHPPPSCMPAPAKPCARNMRGLAHKIKFEVTFGQSAVYLVETNICWCRIGVVWGGFKDLNRRFSQPKENVLLLLFKSNSLLFAPNCHRFLAVLLPLSEA